MAFQQAEPPGHVAVGAMVEGSIYLGIDPFFYFEELHGLVGMPPLSYRWMVREIRRKRVRGSKRGTSLGVHCDGETKGRSRSFRWPGPMHGVTTRDMETTCWASNRLQARETVSRRCDDGQQHVEKLGGSLVVKPRFGERRHDLIEDALEVVVGARGIQPKLQQERSRDGSPRAPEWCWHHRRGLMGIAVGHRKERTREIQELKEQLGLTTRASAQPPPAASGPQPALLLARF